MQPIYFTLKRVKKQRQDRLDCCKLLGDPVMHLDDPNTEQQLNIDGYFLAQISFEELPLHPYGLEKGWLHIFIDPDSLQCHATYSEKEPNIIVDDINEGSLEAGLGDPNALEMVFEGEEGNYLLGDIDPNIGAESEVGIEGKVCLMMLDAYALPDNVLNFLSIRSGDGYLLILIDEEDLKKRDFSHIEAREIIS